MVFGGAVLPSMRTSSTGWSECISGALPEDEYVDLVKQAGSKIFQSGETPVQEHQPVSPYIVCSSLHENKVLEVFFTKSLLRTKENRHGKTTRYFSVHRKFCRSQMAEAVLRKAGGDRFEVYSAGLQPKGINPLTVQVMAEKGFDLSGQRSKGVQEYLGKVLIQTLITLCDDAEKNCPTVSAWEVNTHLHWSFEDRLHLKGPRLRSLKSSAKSATVLKRGSMPG